MSTSNARIARIFPSVEYGFALYKGHRALQQNRSVLLICTIKSGPNGMMSNRTLTFTILGVWALVTCRLGFAAAEQTDWRGFFVTEIQLVVAAVALAYMLRTVR